MNSRHLDNIIRAKLKESFDVLIYLRLSKNTHTRNNNKIDEKKKNNEH